MGARGAPPPVRRLRQMRRARPAAPVRLPVRAGGVRPADHHAHHTRLSVVPRPARRAPGPDDPARSGRPGEGGGAPAPLRDPHRGLERAAARLPRRPAARRGGRASRDAPRRDDPRGAVGCVRRPDRHARQQRGGGWGRGWGRGRATFSAGAVQDIAAPRVAGRPPRAPHAADRAPRARRRAAPGLRGRPARDARRARRGGRPLRRVVAPAVRPAQALQPRARLPARRPGRDDGRGGRDAGQADHPRAPARAPPTRGAAARDRARPHPRRGGARRPRHAGHRRRDPRRRSPPAHLRRVAERRVGGAGRGMPRPARRRRRLAARLPRALVGLHPAVRARPAGRHAVRVRARPRPRRGGRVRHGRQPLRRSPARRGRPDRLPRPPVDAVRPRRDRHRHAGDLAAPLRTRAPVHAQRADQGGRRHRRPLAPLDALRRLPHPGRRLGAGPRAPLRGPGAPARPGRLPRRPRRAPRHRHHGRRRARADQRGADDRRGPGHVRAGPAARVDGVRDRRRAHTPHRRPPAAHRSGRPPDRRRQRDRLPPPLRGRARAPRRGRFADPRGRAPSQRPRRPDRRRLQSRAAAHGGRLAGCHGARHQPDRRLVLQRGRAQAPSRPRASTS